MRVCVCGTLGAARHTMGEWVGGSPCWFSGGAMAPRSTLDAGGRDEGPKSRPARPWLLHGKKITDSARLGSFRCCGGSRIVWRTRNGIEGNEVRMGSHVNEMDFVDRIDSFCCIMLCYVILFSGTFNVIQYDSMYNSCQTVTGNERTNSWPPCLCVSKIAPGLLVGDLFLPQ